MSDSTSTMSQNEVLRAELVHFLQEHRDLDNAIEAIHERINPDLLMLQRLKRKKLHLKDKIRRIEDQITPDIIA